MSIHPEQHPLDGKLEPETKDCFNDRAPLYSIAISLKRIADAPSEAAARITELEGDLKAAFREISKLAREAGEAKGRLEMSEAAGIVDGWRERAERAEARCRALREALGGLTALYDDDEGCRKLPEYVAAVQALEGALPESPSASPAEPSGWRPEVRAFADLMEAQLRANDHKPGWKNDSDLDLFERLGEESAELLAALHRHAKRLSWGDHWVMEDTAPRVGREAADVANFAMMIADVVGALPPTSEGGGE